MQITKLRLSGFKSFVHPTELLIEPGLTGVVGPNGCGKSNLVEALRWVMGESSARGLRGGEMDDVIFAGTAARPAHDLADVTVQLRRAGRPLPQFGDAEELELSRRIGRGAGSVFRVNGREARARDVQLLFADAASGARSTAIVSQGQIGSLVEAKPTDRRRLLEAAAGVAGLQARRHEAELKLQAAEANLVRLQDLLTALEEQHRGLVKQARQAGRYRELGAAYREVEAALLVGRWRTARAELAQAEQAFRQGQDAIDARAQALAQARQARDRAAAILPDLRRNEATLATELARLGERLSAVTSELARLEDTKAHLGERRQQIDQDVAHARSTLADAGAMRQKLSDEHAGLTAAAQQDARELEHSAADERAAWQALERAESAYRSALAAVAEIEARIGQQVERRTRIEQQRDGLDQALRQLRAALAELSEPIPAGGEALAQAEADVVEAKAAAEAAEIELQTAERARLLTRRDELTVKAERGAVRRQALDLIGLEQRVAEAKALVGEAEMDRDAARERVRAADASRERIEAALRAQRTLVERLSAEADALAALVEPKAGPGMIDLVEVQDGYAEALAAALGDDLVGGLDPAAPVHWQNHPAAGDAPALPDGCMPLSAFVSGPPALARRLAQIGVTDPATATGLQALLAQGQRLVSPDGGLWRWDGFVRRPESSGPGAARLRQRARLRQLEDERAQQEAELRAHDEAFAAADAAVRQARSMLEQAEQGLRSATLTFEAARDAAAEARTADAGLAAELTALAEEGARFDHELEELSAEGLACATEAHAGEELSAEQAQAALAASRARASAARERLAAAQAALERCHAAERASALALREGEIERARLHTRLAQLQEDRAGLDEGQKEAAAATSAEPDLARARQALADAQAELAARRQGHAEAGALHVRLRDRQAHAAQRQAVLDSELELWSRRAAASEARLAELASRRSDLAAELARLIELLATLGRQQTEHQTRIAELEAQRNRLDQELAVAEAASSAAQSALDQAEAERVEAREAGARLEGRLERARTELESAESTLQARRSQLPDNLVGDLVDDPADPRPDADQLALLEAKLARLGAARERLGPVNLRAIDEVQELAMRIETLQAELTELTAAIERLRRAIATLNREGRERLRAAFAKVEKHFEALFVRLFGGGRAKLELTDLEDPLAAGLELSASPPGKKLQSVSLLSGGEKALTAIALIFAVFLTRPAPLCILDEVDAPLDDANVDRLGGVLDELAQGTDTRFVVITHHPLTMARMDRLYGVTMAERGISELVSVDLRRAVELRATA